MVYTQPLFKNSKNYVYLKIFMFLYITKLKYTREGPIRNEFDLKTEDCSRDLGCAEEHISHQRILRETCLLKRGTYT